MVKIVWTPEALRDLKNIFDYISLDSPKSASRVTKKIIQRIEILSSFPKMGRVVPEFQREELRELIEGSYRLVYLVKTKSVEVIRIHHSSRLLNSL